MYHSRHKALPLRSCAHWACVADSGLLVHREFAAGPGRGGFHLAAYHVLGTVHSSVLDRATVTRSWASHRAPSRDGCSGWPMVTVATLIASCSVARERGAHSQIQVRRVIHYMTLGPDSHGTIGWNDATSLHVCDKLRVAMIQQCYAGLAVDLALAAWKVRKKKEH
jgi:hypothetical protein